MTWLGLGLGLELELGLDFGLGMVARGNDLARVLERVARDREQPHATGE